jgi:hypothetical protein
MKDDKDDDNIDVMFKKVDRLCTNGRFDEIDHMIRHFNIADSDILTIGLLTITFAVKQKLHERSAFFIRVKERFERERKEEAEALLRGLE